MQTKKPGTFFQRAGLCILIPQDRMSFCSSQAAFGSTDDIGRISIG